ncbi:hypothetical protein IFM89_005147, partial [Coptis chinensis]
ILFDIASKCDGYDAYDLEILVDRAIHAAIGRFLCSSSNVEDHENPILVREDFSQAMNDFLPISMRDITKSASEGGRTGWDEVGGLVNIRNAVQELRGCILKSNCCRPCLLFFDEFDSIAPKRGHDNTGVTYDGYQHRLISYGVQLPN